MCPSAFTFWILQTKPHQNIDFDSKYSIQRTLLRNRLVITNKKLQKINTKTFCASKKENEQMK